MIQNPAILALTVSSIIISILVLFACWNGMQVHRKWDPGSGCELQLVLERRTYLVSTILAYTLVFQVLSLFLYIYTADNLHSLFTGAMCAAGTLHVNGFGYPALLTKVASSMVAGVWLIINHVDTRGYDYPLIKIKYALLYILAPMVVMETYLQYEFFSLLKADVITSCCGSLFSVDRPGFASEISVIPYGIMGPAFFGCMAATAACGLVFRFRGRCGYLFSVVSSLTFFVSAAALISFICLYFYELPTHRCPFCILQKEYGYVGYLLYASLLAGAVTGIGTGALMPFRNRRSLILAVPAMQSRLALITVVLYLLFTSVVLYRILTSSLKLDVF